MEGFLIALLIVFGFALVSGRVKNGPISAPMFFAALGWAVGPSGWGLAPIRLDDAAIHVIAEVTLGVVLFTDATQIDVRRLLKDLVFPARLLFIGLPLTILAGTGAAMALFPSFGLIEAALLAAILAPTDAALGQAVVSDRQVPARVRQSLSVESGLNDGIVLPFILFLVSLGAMAGHGEEARTSAQWAVFIVSQIGFGGAVGFGAGFIGGKLIDEATRAGWLDASFQGAAIMVLAFLTFLAAELVGGNGFIAVFAGGLAFGAAAEARCHFVFEFLENEGRLLTLFTFFVFGADMAPRAFAVVDPPMIAYALASLTAVRMIPVSISLLGFKLCPTTHLFTGWFGPRGLASILFVLVVFEEAMFKNAEAVFNVVVLTVSLSILLHGMSANPLAKRYGARCASLDPDDNAEHGAVITEGREGRAARSA